jgi:hypothetical protein
MKPAVSVHEIKVVVSRHTDGRAEGSVWVLLRDGTSHCLSRCPWPSGAPTPTQLLLFQSQVVDELQTLILTTCGVQGVLDGHWADAEDCTSFS